MIVGIVAVVVVTAYVARRLARSYGSHRLSSERARTNSAISRAEAAYKAAQEDVRRHAQQRTEELQAMKADLHAKLALDQQFYGSVQIAIVKYLDEISVFDSARRKYESLDGQIRESRNLFDQISLAQTQDRLELSQIDQALELLREVANARPRFDLVAFHHPDLAAELTASGMRLPHIRRVLRVRKEQCSKDEHRAIDNLLEVLDEQAEIGEELATLQWARGDVARRLDGLKRRSQAVEIQVKKLRSQRNEAAAELDTACPASSLAVRKLLAYAEDQYQTAKKLCIEERSIGKEIKTRLKFLHEQVKACNAELNKLRTVGGTSAFDASRFAELKVQRGAATAQLTPLKKLRIDHDTTLDRHSAECDLWLARKRYVSGFFTENQQEDMSPIRVRNYIARHQKRSAIRIAKSAVEAAT